MRFEERPKGERKRVKSRSTLIWAPRVGDGFTRRVYLVLKRGRGSMRLLCESKLGDLLPVWWRVSFSLKRKEEVKGRDRDLEGEGIWGNMEVNECPCTTVF